MPTRFRHRNLPMLLLQARERVMLRFRPCLKRHGLTEQQWRVIRALDESGELEIGQIAECCSILGPSLTGVLARMQAAGLITRLRSDADQRRVSVKLTPMSGEIVRALRAAIEAHYRAMEGELGGTALPATFAMLDRLIALPLEQAVAGEEVAQRQVWGRGASGSATCARVWMHLESLVRGSNWRGHHSRTC